MWSQVAIRAKSDATYEFGNLTGVAIMYIGAFVSSVAAVLCWIPSLRFLKGSGSRLVPIIRWTFMLAIIPFLSLVVLLSIAIWRLE